MKRENAIHKLKIMCANLGYMDPPLPYAVLGQKFAEALLSVRQKITEDNIHIAMGYYNSSLKPRVSYLGNESSEKYMLFNLYATEFISDYFIYLDREDDIAFRYLYCKQMRYKEFNYKNYDAAALYNRIYSMAEQQIKCEIHDYRKKAFAVSAFLALHEIAHHDCESISAVKRDIIAKKEEFEKLELTDLTDEEKTEIACDLIALSAFDLNNLNQGFGIGKEEMVGVSVSMITLSYLYDLFSQLTFRNFRKERIESIQKELPSSLERRALALFVMIADIQKNPRFFDDCNLEKSPDIIIKTRGFVNKIIRFYEDDWDKEVKAFKSLSEDEKDEYYLSKNTNVWVYYL